MADLPVIDYIFIFLILLMVIHGYVKGFIEELFSWAALILAVWAAVLLNPAGAAFIRERTMQNVRVVPELFAFLAIFIFVMIVIKLLERVLKEVVSGANLGAINKILGCLFGLVEGVAFTALIIFVLTVQPLFDASKFLGESIFVQYLLPFIRIPLERGKDIIDTVLLVLPEFPA